MKGSNRFLKVISTVLVHSFFLQQLSYAAPDLKPIQLDLFEKPKVGFKIPESVASIEDAYKAPSGDKRVYLLQDAHTNESGQINLAKTLDIILRNEKPLRYVFVEAGVGDDSLSFLRPYATLEKRREVALSYIKKGLLHGEEYLDITSSRDFKLWGVEDLPLYIKAIDAYRYTATERDKFENYLNQIENTIKVLKPRVYNPWLFSFDAAYQKYLSAEGGSASGGKEETSLTDFFEILTKEAEKRDISLTGYPHLVGLKDLKEKESKIDFKKANEEQAKALASLSDADQSELLELAQTTKSPFKLSTQDHKEEKAYYLYLEEKLKAVDSRQKTVDAVSTVYRLPSTDYPELFKYFDYLKLAKKIQAEDILKEEKALEESVFARLAQTPDERNLVHAAKNLRYLRKLFLLTMTPEEFADYSAESRDFDITHLTGFLNKKIMDLKDFYENAAFLEKGFDKIVARAEEFYTITHERDRAFLDNMFSKMTKESETTAVLITGGYHTPNLKSLLKSKNISYVSIRPQVFHETNQKKYEKLLLNQQLDPALVNRTIANANKLQSPNMQSMARLAEVANMPMVLAEMAGAMGVPSNVVSEVRRGIPSSVVRPLSSDNKGARLAIITELTERQTKSRHLFRNNGGDTTLGEILDALSLAHPDWIVNAIQRESHVGSGKFIKIDLKDSDQEIGAGVDFKVFLPIQRLKRLGPAKQKEWDLILRAIVTKLDPSAFTIAEIHDLDISGGAFSDLLTRETSKDNAYLKRTGERKIVPGHGRRKYTVYSLSRVGLSRAQALTAGSRLAELKKARREGGGVKGNYLLTLASRVARRFSWPGIATRTASSTASSLVSTDARRSLTSSMLSPSAVWPSATTRNLDSSRSTSAATSFGVKPLVGSGISNSSITERPSLSGNITSVNSTGARLAKKKTADSQKQTKAKVVKSKPAAVKRQTLSEGLSRIVPDTEPLKYMTSDELDKLQKYLEDIEDRFFSGSRLAEVEKLIKELKDNDPRVSGNARFVLGLIGPAAKAAVPALIDALKDKDSDVRYFAAQALGLIGPKAYKAVPTLTTISQEDSSEFIRKSAGEAIRQIQSGARLADDKKTQEPEEAIDIPVGHGMSLRPAVWKLQEILREDKYGLDKTARRGSRGLEHNTLSVKTFSIIFDTHYEEQRSNDVRYIPPIKKSWTTKILEGAGIIGVETVYDSYESQEGPVKHEIVFGPSWVDVDGRRVINHLRTPPLQALRVIPGKILLVLSPEAFEKYPVNFHVVRGAESAGSRLATIDRIRQIQERLVEIKTKLSGLSKQEKYLEKQPVLKPNEIGVQIGLLNKEKRELTEELGQLQSSKAGARLAFDEELSASDRQQLLNGLDSILLEHRRKNDLDAQERARLLELKSKLQQKLEETEDIKEARLALVRYTIFGARLSASSATNRDGLRRTGVGQEPTFASSFPTREVNEGIATRTASSTDVRRSSTPDNRSSTPDNRPSTFSKRSSSPVTPSATTRNSDFNPSTSVATSLGVNDLGSLGMPANISKNPGLVKRYAQGQNDITGARLTRSVASNVSLAQIGREINTLGAAVSLIVYDSKEIPIIKSNKSSGEQVVEYLKQVPGLPNSWNLFVSEDGATAYIIQPKFPSSPAEAIADGSRLAKWVNIPVPQDFAEILGPDDVSVYTPETAVNLIPERMQIQILSGRTPPRRIFEWSGMVYAIGASVAQALGSILFAGQGETVKEVADGNAVYLNHLSLKTYTFKHPNEAFVILGDEGWRDKSAALPMGAIYYHGEVIPFTSIESLKSRVEHLRSLGVQVYFQVADALEKTVGLVGKEALEGPTDSTSLLAMFYDWNEFLIHDKLRIGGISGHSKGRPSLTPFDLPSEALQKIAKAEGIDPDSTQYTAFVNSFRILTLSERKEELKKETDVQVGHRHDRIIEDAKKLQQTYPGLELITPGDGDAFPRALAMSGLDLGGKRLLVFGRSGAQEAAAATIIQGEDQEAFFENTFVSPSATKAVYNADVYNHYSGQENDWLEETNIPASMSGLSADRQNISIGKGILTFTSVTGASPEITGPALALDLKAVEFFNAQNKPIALRDILEIDGDVAGKVVTSTYFVGRDGTKGIIRTTFRASNLKESLYALRTASPAAKLYSVDGGARLADLQKSEVRKQTTEQSPSSVFRPLSADNKGARLADDKKSQEFEKAIDIPVGNGMSLRPAVYKLREILRENKYAFNESTKLGFNILDVDLFKILYSNQKQERRDLVGYVSTVKRETWTTNIYEGNGVIEVQAAHEHPEYEEIRRYTITFGPSSVAVDGRKVLENLRTPPLQALRVIPGKILLVLSPEAFEKYPVRFHVVRGTESVGARLATITFDPLERTYLIAQNLRVGDYLAKNQTDGNIWRVFEIRGDIATVAHVDRNGGLSTATVNLRISDFKSYGYSIFHHPAGIETISGDAVGFLKFMNDQEIERIYDLPLEYSNQTKLPGFHTSKTLAFMYKEHFEPGDKKVLSRWIEIAKSKYGSIKAVYIHFDPQDNITAGKFREMATNEANALWNDVTMDGDRTLSVHFAGARLGKQLEAKSPKLEAELASSFQLPANVGARLAGDLVGQFKFYAREMLENQEKGAQIKFEPAIGGGIVSFIIPKEVSLHDSISQVLFKTAQESEMTTEIVVSGEYGIRDGEYRLKLPRPLYAEFLINYASANREASVRGIGRVLQSTLGSETEIYSLAELQSENSPIYVAAQAAEAYANEHQIGLITGFLGGREIYTTRRIQDESNLPFLVGKSKFNLPLLVGEILAEIPQNTENRFVVRASENRVYVDAINGSRLSLSESEKTYFIERASFTLLAITDATKLISSHTDLILYKNLMKDLAEISDSLKNLQSELNSQIDKNTVLDYFLNVHTSLRLLRLTLFFEMTTTKNMDVDLAKNRLGDARQELENALVKLGWEPSGSRLAITEFAQRVHELENQILNRIDDTQLNDKMAEFIGVYMTEEVLGDMKQSMLVDHALWRVFQDKSVRRQAVIVTQFLNPYSLAQIILVTVLARFLDDDDEVRIFLQSIINGSTMGLISMNKVIVQKAKNAFSHQSTEKVQIPSQKDDLALLETASATKPADSSRPADAGARLASLEENFGVVLKDAASLPPFIGQSVGAAKALAAEGQYQGALDRVAYVLSLKTRGVAIPDSDLTALESIGQELIRLISASATKPSTGARLATNKITRNVKTGNGTEFGLEVQVSALEGVHTAIVRLTEPVRKDSEARAARVTVSSRNAVNKDATTESVFQAIQLRLGSYKGAVDVNNLEHQIGIVLTGLTAPDQGARLSATAIEPELLASVEGPLVFRGNNPIKALLNRERSVTTSEESTQVSKVKDLLRNNPEIKQAVQDFFVGLEIFPNQQGENRPLALQTDQVTASPYTRVVHGDALSIQLYGEEIIPAFDLNQAKEELKKRLSEEQRATKNNRTIEYQITKQVLAFAEVNDRGVYQGYVEVPVNAISDQLSDDREFAEVIGFLQAYARARKGFNIFFSGINEKILGKARFAVVDSALGVLVDEWNSDKRTGHISLNKPENAVIAKINFVDPSRPSVPALDPKQEVAVPTAGFNGGNVSNLIGAVELGQRLATVYTDIRKTHHNEIPSVADEDVVQTIQKSSIPRLVRELTGIKSGTLTAAELHDAFTARNLASYLKFVIEPLLRYLDDRLRAIQIMQKVAIFA